MNLHFNVHFNIHINILKYYINIQCIETALGTEKTFDISYESCSKFNSRDSFEICTSWGFQNTPWMLELTKFWLRYLRFSTDGIIFKISSKMIKPRRNLMISKNFVSNTALFILRHSNIKKNHLRNANKLLRMSN